MQAKIYVHIANMLCAIENCQQSNNREWEIRWNDALTAIEENALPSGSGFDSGTTIDRDKSNATRIVLHTSYHHMNDGGMYDGWTDHTITIRPDFASGFDMRISGRNRNDIKEYMYDVFRAALEETADNADFIPTTDSDTDKKG